MPTICKPAEFLLERGKNHKQTWFYNSMIPEILFLYLKFPVYELRSESNSLRKQTFYNRLYLRIYLYLVKSGLSNLTTPSNFSLMKTLFRTSGCWEEGIVRDLGMARCTLLYLKRITSKDLLYSIESSAQCYVAAWKGAQFGGDGCMCMDGSVPSMFIWNYHTLLTGDSPTQNKKFKRKKTFNLEKRSVDSKIREWPHGFKEKQVSCLLPILSDGVWVFGLGHSWLNTRGQVVGSEAPSI